MFKLFCSFVTLIFLSTGCLGAETTKDWTIFIHMNGNNSLCSFAQKNLKSLESIDVSAVANVVVAYSCNVANTAKVIYIQGKKETVLASGTIDFGDYNTVIKYSKMAFDKYPAKYRMLVIWNHGNGVEDSWNKDKLNRWVSLDELTNHVITTEELGLITGTLSQYHSLDIVGFDACMMQMAEISYEMKDNISYSLASEETEPGEGWDYASIDQSLLKHPDPITLGKAIVDSYVTFNGGGSDLTLSLVDVKKQALFIDMFKAYIVSNKQKLYDAFNMSTSYSNFSYRDVGVALKKVGATDLLKAYNDSVISNGNNNAGGTGFSMYYTKYPEDLYSNTKFQKYTGWLSEYLGQ